MIERAGLSDNESVLSNMNTRTHSNVPENNHAK